MGVFTVLKISVDSTYLRWNLNHFKIIQFVPNLAEVYLTCGLGHVSIVLDFMHLLTEEDSWNHIPDIR